MAFTYSWSEAAPAAGDPANQAHINIQDVKKAVRERANVDHNAAAGSDADTWTHRENTAKIGQGLAAARPAAATATKGHTFFSTDSKALELDDGSSWLDLLGAALKLAGGAMTGPIAMGASKITGLAAATANGDALQFEHTTAATLDHPDLSVTEAKVAALAVTEGKIGAAAVTATKLAAGLGVQFASGSYVGNNTTQSINAGIDLTSGVWIILITSPTGGNGRVVIRTNQDTTTGSTVCSSDYVTTAITAPTATGFTVGAHNDVNNAGGTYYYFIMKAR